MAAPFTGSELAEAYEALEIEMGTARLLLDLELDDVPAASRLDMAHRATDCAAGMAALAVAIGGEDGDACMAAVEALLEIADGLRSRWSYEVMCPECRLVAGTPVRHEADEAVARHLAETQHVSSVVTVIQS